MGAISSISLAPTLVNTGESVNFGQIGTPLNASAQDCKGSSVSAGNYLYATSDMSIADVNPSNGVVCGGRWNRNTGGGVPDFTICTPPPAGTTKFQAFVTASNGGTSSNPIAIYVHPAVTAVALATPLSDAACKTTTDLTSNCCPLTGAAIIAPGYVGDRCVSQNSTAQIAAKVFAGTTNITCQVGKLSFTPQGGSNIVTIDQNGVATANQPGSVLIAATVSNSASASSAGFFSTCPPASIVLAPVGVTPVNGAINIALNNGQALTANVYDSNIDAANPLGHPLTGVGLEFNSTTPQTISASSGAILATYPGTATITAVCQPPTCNPSPFSQIGLFGNGKPVTSNGLTATAAGNVSSVIYIGSTNSQYLLPVDFTTNQPGSLIKLPYTPNSMAISQDGTSIYLGSPQGLMSVATAGNTVTGTNQAIPGTVLSVSPDGGTIVVTDPTRGTVSLVNNSGAVTTSYGGVGVRAQWTPNSQTVYIVTTTNILLTHSNFENWQSTSTDSTSYKDVAVTVPGVGAYFAGTLDNGGGGVTEGRSYCASTTLNTGTGNPPTAANSFFPLADQSSAQTDRIAATTDGRHIIGAAVVGGAATVSDIAYNLPTKIVGGNTVVQSCPQPPAVVAPGYFTSSVTTAPLANIIVSGAGAITGVIPATNSGLSFITYTGTSGLLPYYIPATGGQGTLKYLTLGNGATATSAPISGVFATDNKTFYAGTSGDNQVHLIGINGTTAAETGVITPKLPDANNNTAAPDLIVQRPKRATS